MRIPFFAFGVLRGRAHATSQSLPGTVTTTPAGPPGPARRAPRRGPRRAWAMPTAGASRGLGVAAARPRRAWV